MTSKIKVKYPLGVQWKIAKNELQKLRASNGDGLDSDTFGIPETDIKYFLTIFPNGEDDESRGQTWIFLYLENEGKKEIKSEYSISIDSANYSKTFEYVFKESDGWGSSLCTVEELFDPVKQFIVDGEMVIKVNGYLMIEKDVPVCKLGNRGIKLCINLWNQQTKDFTILADEKEIHAHKWVLSTHSSVFSAMFQPHTKEAQEGKVIIPDFPFNVVEAAIKFCYDSSLVKDVSLEDQMSLLQFFDKYDMRSLKIHLSKHLISVIDETNVCRVINSSIISNAPKLQAKCTKFLRGCINTKPVNDIDILDKDFVLEFFQNSFYNFSG